MSNDDAESVLEALAECGNLSMACRETDISKTTFLRWCDASPANADRYTRAREAGLDAQADLGLSEALDCDDAALGRLALDARKWYLSKLMPKKYGDKVAIGGADDLPSIKQESVGLDTVIARLAAATGASETDALRALAATSVEKPTAH